MSAETITYTVAAEQGWNDDTLLSLTQTYVENQQSPEALADYLRGIAEEENEGGEEIDSRLSGSAEAIIDAQGWTDATLIGLLLTYVDRQADNPAFEDYLRGIAEEENGGPVCEDCDEDDGDGLDYECDNCGNAITELGLDATGSRRCDDLDPTTATTTQPRPWPVTPLARTPRSSPPRR